MIYLTVYIILISAFIGIVNGRKASLTSNFKFKIDIYLSLKYFFSYLMLACLFLTWDESRGQFHYNEVRQYNLYFAAFFHLIFWRFIEKYRSKKVMLFSIVICSLSILQIIFEVPFLGGNRGAGNLSFILIGAFQFGLAPLIAYHLAFGATVKNRMKKL